MGVFNIIETFFFISLAITFILILLIVNHFKQRINSIEQKCDTMFEIINNLIQEFGVIKRIQTFNMHNGTPMSKSTPEIFTENIESIEPTESTKPSNIKSKIVVSDDEYENITNNNDETDSDENDDDEYSEDSDEYSEDEIVDDEYDKKINIDIFENDLKIVNLDEDIKIIEKTNLEENINDLIQVEKIETIELIETIDTIDNTESIENKINTSQEMIKENMKDIYNKMSAQELKKIVITKGLCSDPSKMKKNELLKMLEIE